jgi:hypothetical protein
MAKIVFGLDFKNNSGEAMQFAVDTDTEHVKIRVTKNGQWTTWQRIDVKRKASGELDETVFEAKRAETADKFSTPVRLNFSGAVSGSLIFDGSTKDMNVNLSVGAAVSNAISSAISSHVSQYHSYSGGGNGGYDW